MPKDRLALYVEALADFNEQQMKYGFGRALREFKPEYGVFFPVPSMLRDWCCAYRPAVDESRAILMRGDKPPDWVPLDQLKAEMVNACKFPEMKPMTPAQIQERIENLKRQAGLER